MFGMRKESLFFAVFSIFAVSVANAAFTSCGPGYVLVEKREKIDGVQSAECQRLWCRDLENGKQMGNNEKPNSGYQLTSGTIELCDVNGNCVECWGERKWCGDEARGEWNPEYGAYTRSGDSSTYESYQKGSCFAWRLEKPTCPDGETAILKAGNWVCAVSTGTTEASRSSAIRRTGTMRRITR